MQVTLAGKVAIVTGAASGIGLATLVKFLEAGVDGVIAVDLAPEPAELLARARDDGRLKYVRGDAGAARAHYSSA